MIVRVIKEAFYQGRRVRVGSEMIWPDSAKLPSWAVSLDTSVEAPEVEAPEIATLSELGKRNAKRDKKAIDGTL